MRKKQLATRLSVEPGLEDGTVIDGESETEGACEKSPSSRDADMKDSVPYRIDSSGQAVLHDGTLVIEPVSADCVPKSVHSDIIDNPLITRKTVKQISPGVLDVIKCTGCGIKLHAFANTILLHPVLKVAICSRCSKFYGRQEFLQDSCGKDENCRWCADGGDLICCDTCSNAFCKRCIKRNLGRGVLQKIESLGDNDTWSCFVCDRTPILSLQCVCDEVLEKVQELSFARKRRSSRAICGWRTRLSAHAKVQSPVKVLPKQPIVPTRVAPQSIKPTERICVPASDAIKTISAVLTHLSQLGTNNIANSFPSTNTSKLAEALRSVTQSLPNAATVNSTGVTSGTSSTLPAATTPLGRPTILIRDIPSVDAANTSVTGKNQIVAATTTVPPPTVSAGPTKAPQSFDIGIILSQIANVNTGNIDVAIKATRRCIETFSADLHRLESKLPKAKEACDIARIVRSFQSIYRFHFFARLANLSSRIREETGQSGASSSIGLRPGMSQSKTSPNGTIDLTEDTDQSCVHTAQTPNNTTPPSTRDSSVHKSSRQQLKVNNTSSSCHRLSRSPSPPLKRHRSSLDNTEGLPSSSSQSNSTEQTKREKSKLSMQSHPATSHPSHASREGEDSAAHNNSHSTTPTLNSSPEGHESKNSCENGNMSKPSKDKDGNAGRKAEGDGDNEEDEDDEDDVEWKLNVLASLARRTDASETDVDRPEESNTSSAKVPQSGRNIGASVDGSLVSDARNASCLNRKPGRAAEDSSDAELETLEAEVTSMERSQKSKDQLDGSLCKSGNDADNTDHKRKKSAKDTTRSISARFKAKRSRARSVDTADESSDRPTNDIKATGTLGQDSGEAATPDPSLGSNSEADGGDDDDDDEVVEATPAMKSSSDENSNLGTALLDKEEEEFARNMTSREELLHSSSGDDEDLGSADADRQPARGQKLSQPEKEGKHERSSPTAPYHGLPRSLMTSAWSSSGDEEENKKSGSTAGKAGTAKSKHECRVGTVTADEQNKQSDDGSLSHRRPRRSRTKADYRELDDHVDTSASDNDDDCAPAGESYSDVEGAASRRKAVDQSPASEDDESSGLERKQQHRQRQSAARRRSTRRVRTMSDEEEAEDGSSDRVIAQGNGDDDEDDDEFAARQQGRKKIRAILGDGRLSQTTKTAEAQERERRRRISERQKVYNDCVLQEGTGLHVVTKKLVLEKPSDHCDVAIEVNTEILKHLKPHQVEAVRFLWDCCIESVERHKSTAKQSRGEVQPSGAILAHCMGLGKTLSVIAFVHTLFSYPDVLHMRSCLVICPVNTLLNWKHEFEIWLPENSDIEVFHLDTKSDTSLRADILKRWHSAGGVMLIGYDMFRNLVNNVAKRGRKKSAKEAVTAALLDPGPDLVVCDEGHLLKNTKSGLSKAVSEIGSFKRIMLTGTPLQNRLSEYHAMVNFVKPNLLGTEKEFSNRFANPIKNGQHRNSTEFDVNLMKRRAHVLYKTLEGCVQRKDYSALTKYLPPRHEYVIKCRLTDVQCILYRRYLQLRNEPITGAVMAFPSSGGVRRTTLFADQQTLYRIWTHPYTLRLHETREARKALLLEEEEEEEDDAFIVDSSSSASSSSSDEEEGNSSAESGESPASGSHLGGYRSDQEADNGDEARGERAAVAGNTTAAKSTRYATRSNSHRQAVAAGDDVVVSVGSSGNSDEESGSRSQQPGKKRLKAGGRENLPVREGETTEAATKDEPWWYEYYKDEYDWRVDVGVKLDVLFRFLKKCQDIGDKMLIFTHSLFSLDLIERFLGELHRQWLVSQGEQSSAGDQTNGNLENRADLSDYFSDIGLNTWIRGLDYERMDGSMNATVRKDLQRRFNRPQNTRFRLFLISTRAGGLGINLISANRIVMFDASWNPSHDIQSIFRSYRFGQVKPVYIYRLIAQGTMEEKIYDRQVTKQSLSLRVIDERQIDRHFTFGDLQALFDFDPDEWSGPDSSHKTLQLPKDRLLADMLADFPWLLSGYHEHDSLLEHREDENLTEAQRQEAWREYEQEKSSGVSLAQYQRVMAAHQEQVALYQQQQQQALAQLRLQKNLQQQQLLLGPSPLRMATTNLLPPRPTMVAPSAPPILAPTPRPVAVVPPSPEIAFPQLYNRLRAHLLASHPSLSADPIRVEKLVMNRLLETLMKPIDGPLPAAIRKGQPGGPTSTSTMPPAGTSGIFPSRPPPT